MTQQDTDFTAGRLSVPTQPGSTGKGRKKTNYGVARLGIAAESKSGPSEEAPEQHPPEPEAARTSSSRTPERAKARATLKEMAAEVAPAGGEAAGRLRRPKKRRRRASAAARLRGRPVLLLAGAAGGLLAVGVVLAILWGIRSNTTVPKTASADQAGRQDGSGIPPESNRQPDKTQATRADARPQPEAAAPPDSPGRPDPTPQPGDEPTWAQREPPSLDATVKPSPPAPAAAGQDPPPGLVMPAVELLRMAVTGALNAWRRPNRQRPEAAPEGPAPASARTPPAKSQDAPPASPPPAGREKPKAAYAVCPPGIVLSCIMHGSGRPVAIINNRSVKVGQTVNNAKVIRISQFSVELERDGQRFLVGVSTPAARRQSETSDQDEAEPAPDAEPEEQES